MKKKWTGLVLCSCLVFATGCQTVAPQGLDHNGGAHEGIEGKGATSIYQNRTSPNGDEDAPERSIFPLGLDRDLGMNRDFGLGGTGEPGTRMGRDQIPYGYDEHSARDAEVIQQGYGAQSYIDRQVLADSLSQIVVGLQNVDHAAVIITDDECIIGYQGAQNNQNLQEQVEKAGLSITPRWFKVYATDNIQLVQSIRDISSQQGNQHREDQLEQHVQSIIQQLGGPKESWEQDTQMDTQMGTDTRGNR
jgi:hypothetical protein